MEKRIYAYLAVIVTITMIVSTLAMTFLIHDILQSPVSLNELSFGEILLSMIPVVTGVLVLLLVTLYLLSHRLTDRLLEPIKRIASSVESILTGNPVREISVYPEIRPFIDTIDRQKKQIDLALYDLREAEKVRRDFTANVSHELKTPLTSIIGYAEMMNTGTVGAEDTKKFSGIIHKEGTRLLGLIDSIISLSRIEDTNALKSFETIDLYSLSKELIEQLRVIAREKDIYLFLEGSSLSVRGDRRMLQDLVFNLLDNGIKYNRFGGSVTIKLSEDSAYGIISVSDTGIGIPKDDVERVFERFYMVDKSRSKKVGGSGLGLSIVKHIAAYHGGSVKLESEVGKGTEMVVKLSK